MKIACFSDIQANVPALEAVIEEIERWQPDLIVMDGDLVNRGPDSVGCLQLWQAFETTHNCRPLRGNHEDFVYYCSIHPPPSEIEAAIRAFTDWTVEQLGKHVGDCRPWPDHLLIHAPESIAHWVHFTHGTLHDNRHGIRPEMTDDEIAALIPHGVDCFVTAHTHRPMMREVNDTLVINAGSAGSPFDGDPRGSYCRLVWKQQAWHGQITRFDYDRDRARRAFFESGFIDEGGPMARLIYEEWERATSLIPYWHRRFREAIANREISPEKAVDVFLAEL